LTKMYHFGTFELVKVLDAEKLIEGHADARKRLSKWRSVVETEEWKTPIEMKQSFPTADLVGAQTVFDIGSHRIITVIEYEEKIVLVDDVLTHDEYMKDGWKR
jgi:mRNA interferase HigB